MPACSHPRRSQTRSPPFFSPSELSPPHRARVLAMSEPYASSSVAHKRTYDDLGREDAPGPSGSRTDPSSSSSSSTDPSTNRDRNKRARNDLDSEFASEIEDILLSSNNSVSSSSSGSSYHSARSTLSAVTSPLRLPVVEPIDEDPPSIDVPPARYSPRPFTSIDVSMDDTIFSITPPHSPPRLPIPSPTTRHTHTDAADQLRRAMERATAFDREISALRQSPVRPVSPPTPPPVWQSWTAQFPRDTDDIHTSFDHALDFTVPEVQPSLSSNAQNAPSIFVSSNTSSPVPPPASPISNLVPSSSSYSYSTSGLGFPPFEPPQYSRPLPSPQQYRWDWRTSLEDDMWRDDRELDLNANAAASRTREREDSFESFWDRPLPSDRLEPSRPAPVTSYSTSLDSPRLLERRRSHATVPPAPSTRPPLSASPAPPNLHALVDDFWHREHDREIRNLDHTIREAEVHRQRVADFLAERESPRLSSTRLTRERANPVAPSSSYSSLRGALDDTAIRRRAHITPRPVSQSSARPPAGSLVGRPRRVFHIEEYEPPTVSFYRPDYLSLHPSDGPAPRSTSQSATHDDVLDISPHPEPTYDDLSSYTSNSSLSQGSYLEANRTARAEHFISVLRHRHRTRPRSPSPPPPLSTSSSSFRYPYDRFDFPRSEQRSRHGPTSSRSVLDRTSQRESTSSAIRPSFADLPPYGITEPERPPAQPPVPLPRLRRHGHFDPNAYRAGPFRATMARSMALQMQNERERERDPEPSPFTQDTMRRGLAAESSSSEEDEPYNHYLSLLREVQPPSLQTDRPAQSPRSVAPVPPMMGRARAITGHLSRRLLPERQASATADSSDSRSTRAAESQTPTDRLLDLLGRPSAPPVGPRHRTLLSRERSLSSFRDYLDEDLRLPEERLEQRREVLERIRSRAAELHGYRYVPPPPGSLSGAPPSSASSQRDNAPGAPRAYAHSSHIPVHTTLPRRNRASFSVLPPRGLYPTDARPDDRATPLN
ncbi:hypothetical protein C8Q80DRAFT_1354652, partial [Daedaleopsis nitida]